MPRCSQCNKWAALEQAEPEAEVELDNDEIIGNVRIALTCVDCGQEIKQAEFSVQVDVSEHTKHKCPDADLGIGWGVEMDDLEPTMRQHPPKGKVRTTFYGASGNLHLTCQCDEVGVQIPWSDEIKASAMEEL